MRSEGREYEPFIEDEPIYIPGEEDGQFDRVIQLAMDVGRFELMIEQLTNQTQELLRKRNEETEKAD